MQANVGDIITWQTEGPDPLTLQGKVAQILNWPVVNGKGGSVRSYVISQADGETFWAVIVPVDQVTSVFQKVKQEGGSDE